MLKGGTAALASTIGPWPIARAADTLTVAAYGGEFRDIFTRTVVEPFEKKFLCKVIYDDRGTHVQNYAKIRAGRGNVGFDVAAELTASQIVLGAKIRFSSRSLSARCRTSNISARKATRSFRPSAGAELSVHGFDLEQEQG